jgi:hypothetical protein
LIRIASIENFDTAKEIVVDYHERYPNKPGPQSVMISLISQLIRHPNWIKKKSRTKTLNMMEERTQIETFDHHDSPSADRN